MLFACDGRSFQQRLASHWQLFSKLPLEYFHTRWKGREEQLDEQPDEWNGQEDTDLERALRIALAQADSWTLREEGLNRLLGLCSSEGCREDVKGWLSQAAAPVEIQIVPGFGGFRARVAQYETRSDEQLRRKILQFPAGTVFRVVPLVKGDYLARVEQIVRLAGYSLAAQ